MIPKIIHYVWLGNSQMPDLMSTCINSWRKWMPDYRLICWNDDRIKEINSIFVKEAIQEKKWAFASDVIRLYAICKYGGIYMDTDVMVHKPFDDLLDNHAFIGRENSIHFQGRDLVNYLTTCCFGAEAGNEFILKCYDYYTNRHFISVSNRNLPTQLRLDTRLNSEIFCILAQEIGYNASILADRVQICDHNQLTIYPSHAFDATSSKSLDTYSQHLALGTWREGPRKVYTYSFRDKISWRVRAIVSKVLRHYGYIMFKLT